MSSPVEKKTISDLLLLIGHWKTYGSNFNIIDINTVDIFIYNTVSWTGKRNFHLPHPCNVF